MMKKLVILFTVLAMAGSAIGMIAIPVSAAIITPEDLISLVNNIRTGTYGLPALRENSILDYTAQDTAQIMADNGYTDHLAFLGYAGVIARVEAAGYGNGDQVFATENWAGSMNGTLSWIQSVWVDEEHMIPMTNSYLTDIGAGVATASNGRTIYIVHAAYDTDHPGSGGSSSGTGSYVSSAAATTPTSDNFIPPVITSTPHPDGSVVHKVESGQTLWQIALAYHTTILVLQEINGISGNNIIPGQYLVMPSPTPTVTPTITATILTPTRTITPTHLPPTITPTLAPSITPTLEGVQMGSFTLDRRTIGIIIIAICALGLGAVVFTSMRKK